MLILRALLSSGIVVEQTFVYDKFDETMNTLFSKFVTMVTDNTIYPGDVLVRVEWLDGTGKCCFKKNKLLYNRRENLL